MRTSASAASLPPSPAWCLVGNLSVVFHFASLVVLLALAILVLRLQVMVKLWRDWGGPQSDNRILVGEPLRALRQFACAIGAEFDSEIRLDFFDPAKIKLQACFELHRRAFVEGVEVKGGEKPCVFFILRHEPSTISEINQKLLDELGGAVAVQFKKA